MNRGNKAMMAKFAAVRDQPPPPHPPGSDRRPLEGFPAWYAIDRDQVVWIARLPGGRSCPWRPLSTFLRGRLGRRVCVKLTGFDGRQVFRSIKSLHRAAFLGPQLPLGRTIFPDWYDDEDDEAADAGLPPTPPGGPPELGPAARGSQHCRAKLDEPRVARLKRLRLSGWSVDALAREFGVCRGNIYCIVNGKTWVHVEPEPPRPLDPADAVVRYLSCSTADAVEVLDRASHDRLWPHREHPGVFEDMALRHYQKLLSDRGRVGP
jgi:hypothetical protein